MTPTHGQRRRHDTRFRIRDKDNHVDFVIVGGGMTAADGSGKAAAGALARYLAKIDG